MKFINKNQMKKYGVEIDEEQRNDYVKALRRALQRRNCASRGIQRNSE